MRLLLLITVLFAFGYDADACPRCRRAAPKGPLKRPDPRYMPGVKHENQ